jgi:anti-sigma factor RsiW
MDQATYEAMLADYLGDELSAAQRAQFEAHLATHPARADEVAELRATLAELNGLHAQAPPAPPGNSQSSVSPATASTHGGWGWARTLGKAAALVFLGVLLGRSTAPPGDPEPMEATPIRARTEPPNLEGVHPGWVALVERVDGDRAAMLAGLRYLVESRY